MNKLIGHCKYCGRIVFRPTFHYGETKQTVCNSCVIEINRKTIANRLELKQWFIEAQKHMDDTAAMLQDISEYLGRATKILENK